jgi:hypothetical protein
MNMGIKEEYEGRSGASATKDTNQDQGNVPPVGECHSLAVKSRAQRKDVGRLHAVRHAVLSRYPLEALRHLGEDLKALRRLEKRFRADLKPQGAIAELVFDRFWSSYLRCLLAARTEANVFLRQGQDRSNGKARPRLLDGDLPILVVDQDTEAGSSLQPLGGDTLHELALVQRYDRHFGKEMYNALALLLVLRKRGEAGLEDALANIFGFGG